MATAYCKHSPRHPWSQQGFYADISEQFTEGFTKAFFPTLFDDYDGWPHPTTKRAVTVIKEVLA